MTDNYIVGNFSRGDGAGVAHYGLSNDGLIADNTILTNETFEQTAGRQWTGSGGGIFIGGHATVGFLGFDLSPGAGDVGSSVRVLRNRIQGNYAGTGDGGGIALRLVNGADVIARPGDPDLWFRVDIMNNMIVNNAAGWTAGGISLVDAINTRIIGNTIANNDSTGTATDAFSQSCAPEPFASCAWPAGIVSKSHTDDFQEALDDEVPIASTFSDPEMSNNIVVGNRSWFFNGTSPGATGFTTGTLDPNPDNKYIDFGVVDGDYFRRVRSDVVGDLQYRDLWLRSHKRGLDTRGLRDRFIR